MKYVRVLLALVVLLLVASLFSKPKEVRDRYGRFYPASVDFKSIYQGLALVGYKHVNRDGRIWGHLAYLIMMLVKSRLL